MKLVTADQMRNLDQQAVKAGVPLSQLMENAGLGVAQYVRKMLANVRGRRVLVLAGPGNNGGDGLVAARYLHDWGAETRVYLLAKRRSDEDNYRELMKRELDMADAEDDVNFAALDRFLSDAEVVIDALLGIGPPRPIEANLAAILDRLRRARESRKPPRLVAVDVPTGLNSDTGAVDPHCVPADATVTFGFSKVGLHTLPGSRFAGYVEVVDIGIPAAAGAGVKVNLLTAEWVAGMLPARPLDANKGTFGRVLVVGGSENFVGAVRLAAAGAARVGAGVVTVACPRSIYGMIAAGLTEATYLPLAEKDGGISERATSTVLDLLEDFNVLLLGCGLGRRGGTMAFVRSLLFSLKESTRVGIVLDADGLNILGGTPNWPAQVNVPMVMTPHPGELRRLTGRGIPEIQADRLGVVMRYASEWNQEIVLKGAHSVIAAPDERAAVSPFANPALATGGTGDVLAGAIAGLLAQGMGRFEAAACGVYLHAAAGERVRETLGETGAVAGDLLPEIPKVIKGLR